MCYYVNTSAFGGYWAYVGASMGIHGACRSLFLSNLVILMTGHGHIFFENRIQKISKTYPNVDLRILDPIFDPWCHTTERVTHTSQ
mgnify:FL=1